MAKIGRVRVCSSVSNESCWGGCSSTYAYRRGSRMCDGVNPIFSQATVATHSTLTRSSRKRAAQRKRRPGWCGWAEQAPRRMRRERTRGRGGCERSIRMGQNVSGTDRLCQLYLCQTCSEGNLVLNANLGARDRCHKSNSTAAKGMWASPRRE
jgi:hypothetical protein